MTVAGLIPPHACALIWWADGDGQGFAQRALWLVEREIFAKTHLSRYVDQAVAGEEVVITADLKADFKDDIEAMFHGD